MQSHVKEIKKLSTPVDPGELRMGPGSIFAINFIEKEAKRK